MSATPRMKRETRNGKRETSSRGFTLMEVMFAVMILGIGLIAAGSLIPVAGGMQRTTFDQVIAHQHTLSAVAMVERLKFDIANWQGMGTANQPLRHAFSDSTGQIDANSQNYKDFPLIDRSAPSGDHNQDGVVDRADVALRTLFWEPYYRWDDVGNRWQVFLVIFRRTDDATGAIDAATGEQLQSFMVNLTSPVAGQQNIGEQVLANNGTVRLVIDASNPIPGWIGKTVRVDPTWGATNMEVMQVVGLTGVTR